MKNMLRQTMNHQYPLMRDPLRQPKCYELTDQERLAAVLKVDELLKDRVAELQTVYYGA